MAAADTPSFSTLRSRAVVMLVPVYPMVMASTPAVVIGLVLDSAPTGISRFLVWAASVPLAGLVYAFTCAFLSIPTQSAIIAGRFPRKLGHPVYEPRRLYALCWTSLCYCSPVYHAVLAIPLLKLAIFRLFGYRGSLAVQIYPDTWLRDLPLLKLHEGAYLSNRATIGTNMCLTDGTVIVAPIRVDRGAMVGHMVMLGPGCRIGEEAEIGVGAGIGIHVDIGARVKIGPCAIINHGARIEQDAEIGLGAYIGLRAVIGKGLVIPHGLVVSDRAKIRTAEDLASLIGTSLTPRRRASISDVGVHEVSGADGSCLPERSLEELTSLA